MFSGQQITVCKDTAAPSGREINVCNATGGTVPSEIVVCKDNDQAGSGSVDPCAGAAALTLTGPFEMTVGDTYTAAGGVESYTYAFDSGTISAAGVITAINSCSAADAPRTGIVTVTDSCGSTASVIALLPGGYWKLATALGCGSTVGNWFESYVDGQRIWTFGWVSTSPTYPWGQGCLARSAQNVTLASLLPPDPAIWDGAQFTKDPTYLAAIYITRPYVWIDVEEFYDWVCL